MSLSEIRDKIIEYGKMRGEKWSFKKGSPFDLGRTFQDKDGKWVKCIDTFTLNYMVALVDWFLNKRNGDSEGKNKCSQVRGV
jgi:hypothetical protein